MKRCDQCGRKFNGPGTAGPICKRKLAARSGMPSSNTTIATPELALKAFFMSSPRTKATDHRTWLVRPERGPGSWLVRIFPDADGRIAVCDCPDAKAARICIHVQFVDPIDANKFKMERKQNEKEI